MIKAVLLDFAGVVRQKGDLMEPLVEFCPSVSYEYAKELYNRAKINEITNDEYEKHFTKEAFDWLIKNSTIHEGLENFLHKNKLPIYVASNYVTSVIEKELTGMDIRDFFNGFFVSDKLRVAKPNKEFYLKILEELQLKPEEVLFADDQKRNLVTSKELGIISVWVNNTRVDPFGNNGDVKVDYEIYKIDELLEIIKKINSGK
jgi:HAD superfamily hydrolase (TIGR01509 family)